MKRYITWNEIKIEISKLDRSKKYYGVPRGGCYISAMLNPVMTPEEADIIIDDLIDSGTTKTRYKKLYPDKPFVGLFEKDDNDVRWYIFPWEVKDETKEASDYLIRIGQLLNIKLEIKK